MGKNDIAVNNGFLQRPKFADLFNMLIFEAYVSIRKETDLVIWRERISLFLTRQEGEMDSLSFSAEQI